MGVLIIYIALIITTAGVATRVGRSSIGYALLAFVCSPLVALVILAVLGRTEENQAKRNIQFTYIEEEIRNGLSFEEAKQAAKYRLNKPHTETDPSDKDNGWIWEISLFVVFALLLIGIIIYNLMV